MTSFEVRIREARQGLTPSFNVLADFMLDSFEQAAFLSATELAHALDLDPATVVRFAQRLGYPGYPELQREVQARVMALLQSPAPGEGNSPEEAAMQAFDTLSDLIRQAQRGFSLDAAAALINQLDQAQRVVLFAEGLALAPARALGGWLELGGYTVHYSAGSPSDLARALTGIHRDDLVLAVEIDGETPMLARALDAARKQGAYTVALTATPSDEITSHAELVLSARPSADPAVGQVMVGAITYALIRMLMRARPVRFGPAEQRVRDLAIQLAGSETS